MSLLERSKEDSAMSTRFVTPLFGAAFTLLIVFAAYLQWEIWHAL
jgi:hypothetical protein